MIYEIKGDLLHFFEIGLLQGIAHGCNMQGKMASGVAGQIARKWPEVKEDYLFWHSRPVSYNDKGIPIIERNPFKLGAVKHIYVDHGCVYNLLTQEYYGNDGKVYASLEAIEKALNILADDINYHRSGYKAWNVGLPRIGCGLGGLDWETQVKPIFEKVSLAHQVNFYVFSL